MNPRHLKLEETCKNGHEVEIHKKTITDIGFNEIET